MDSQSVKCERFDFVLNIVPVILQGLIPIYIDEAAINLENKKKYCWMPKGETLVSQKASNVKNITILGAMTPNGVLCYQLIGGWACQYIFMGFLANVLNYLKTLKDYEKYVFVFDQAPSHVSANIKKYY